MTRADTEQVKVHYKGKEDDFIVLAESVDAVKKWKGDKTIPLIDVVNSFDVFTTNKHGVQGQLDRASKGVLENEFGSSKDDDVVTKILEKGDVQETKAHARQGERNPTNGPGVGGVH
jgi:ribosome maturation protein Sdo1